MVSRDKHVDRVNDDFTELSILLKTRGGLSLVDERLETSLHEILKAETNLDDLVKKLEKNRCLDNKITDSLPSNAFKDQAKWLLASF